MTPYVDRYEGRSRAGSGERLTYVKLGGGVLIRVVANTR